MTPEQLKVLAKEIDPKKVTVPKPNLLNSGVFTEDKNIAFAFLKEFFIKYEKEEMTNAALSNLLSEDVNNLFEQVRHQTEKNSEAIKYLKSVQNKNRNELDNML